MFISNKNTYSKSSSLIKLWKFDLSSVLIIALSSSGRTTDFLSVNLGSNPNGVTNMGMQLRWLERHSVKVMVVGSSPSVPAINIQIMCTHELLLIVLAIILLFCFYILFRNELVCDFLCKISRLELTRSEEAEKQGLYFKFRHLSNKYSYNEILYSFKPLKLKYWFTKEEIHYLTTPVER